MATKYLKNETYSIDSETGKPMVMSKTYAIKPKPQDSFYMTYIDNLAGFFRLKSAIDIKVLTLLCVHAQYDENVVYITPFLRQKISEDVGISSQQITNSIRSLKANGLVKGEKGTYMLNPMVYWKGRNSIRDQEMSNGGYIEFTASICHKAPKEVIGDMVVTLYEPSSRIE